MVAFMHNPHTRGPRRGGKEANVATKGTLTELYEKFGAKVLAELEKGSRTKEELAKAIRGLDAANVRDVTFRIKWIGKRDVHFDRKTKQFILGGEFTPPAKPAKEPAPVIDTPDDEPITAVEEDAVLAEQDEAKPKRTRRPGKDGEASGTAKAIAASHEPDLDPSA